MGEKSRRKGPAPRHADGKLDRTYDHPYAPWSFTPSSRAPTAWVKACLSCVGLSAARTQARAPASPRASHQPCSGCTSAPHPRTSWLQAPQAPGLCRDEQNSRISALHLSGAPILLPDLEGTKLSNFQ
uniref:Uncharacterized protein n=1 Tax=Pan paniscus TaxID=9597 RepID=A0A2R9C851_PANPA